MMRYFQAHSVCGLFPLSILDFQFGPIMASGAKVGMVFISAFVFIGPIPIIVYS